jgi:phosphatidylglycerophosphate synthase
MASPEVTRTAKAYGERVDTIALAPESGTRTVVRLHPTLVSVTGAVLCIAAGVALAAGAPSAFAAVLFPVGSLCDFFDGRLARSSPYRGSLRMGAFADSICDKLGEAGLFLGLVVSLPAGTPRILVISGFTLGALTSYTKAVAGEHQLGMTWPEARLFGRAGRAILLSATLIAAATVSDRYWVFIIGFGALAVFNGASFFWRIGRVFYGDSPTSERHL